ncbi:MAG TPA: type II secretion system protein M [Dehalococcoidia bacterium]|nr:type II secretion system protein M [Dehalococcoidia bacterium]
MKNYRARLEAELNRQLAPLRARYEALPQREQRLVVAAGGALALFLLYLVLWEPPALLRAHHEQELARARAFAQRLEEIGAQVQQARPAGAAAARRDVSLLTAVDQATKDGTLGKPPSRMQPDGDTQVRVWFEGVPFDSLLRWIYDLQSRYGIRVDSLDVERQPTAGVVNARLTLVRGS